MRPTVTRPGPAPAGPHLAGLTVAVRRRRLLPGVWVRWARVVGDRGRDVAGPRCWWVGRGVGDPVRLVDRAAVRFRVGRVS